MKTQIILHIVTLVVLLCILYAYDVYKTRNAVPPVKKMNEIFVLMHFENKTKSTHVTIHDDVTLQTEDNTGEPCLIRHAVK